MQIKSIIIFIIAVVVAGAGAYYLGYNKGYGVGFDSGKEVGMAAAKTGAGAAVTNPLEGLPETNPFEEVVNPFKDLYKNPFK